MTFKVSNQTLIISGLLALISASLMGVQVSLGTNTLFHSHSWVVEKREIEFGLTGSDEYLATRAPLYNGILHLGKWYGHQSVRSPILEDLVRGSLQFKLASKDQYLSVKVNDPNYTHVGVVLSHHSKKSNAFWGQSEFERKEITWGINTKWQKWNTLEFERVERDLIFKVDGKEIFKHTLQGPFSLKSVTLQSGLKGALVDEVHLENEKGETFHDSFFDIKRALLLGFVWLLTLVALKMSLMAFLPSLDTRIVQLVFLVLIVCQSAYYVADKFLLSKNEVSPFSKTLGGQDLTSLPNKIEKFRWGLFHLLGFNSPLEIPSSSVLKKRGYPAQRIWEGPIVCTEKMCQKRRLETATQIISRAQSRMILLGTSQSVGSGASALEKTFFSRLHHGLQTKLKGSRLVSLNLSESGSNPQLLFQKYGKTIQLLSPEILVINLANNGDDLNYYKGMSNLIKLALKKSSRIFLIQEAINPESDVHFDKRREYLSTLESSKVHVLDLNKFMSSSGHYHGDFLYWDFIHFNDNGHALAGEWLSDQIIKTMSAK